MAGSAREDMNTIYKIRNKETGEFWDKPYDGMGMWFDDSSARGLFTRHNKKYGDGKSWNEQDEYEIVAFQLVEKELFEEMQNFYNGYFLGYRK